MMTDTINSSANVVDQVATMSKTISEYGIGIVAMGVIIVLFIVTILIGFAYIKKTNADIVDSNNEMMDSLLEQNKKMMEMMMGCKQPVEKHGYCGEHKPSLVSSYVSISSSLKGLCKSIMEKMSCDRVAVYVFHNGNSSIHGLPFFKMSCIGEWTNRGVAPNVGKYHTDLPLYLYSNMIESLYDNGEYVIPCIKDQMDKDPQIVEFANYPNMNSVAAFKIVDDHDNLAGFTVIEYKTERPLDDVSFYTKMKDLMLDSNQTIGDIIINFTESLE